jgi:hypothetical protein
VYIHEQEKEKIWDPWVQQMVALLLQAHKEVAMAAGLGRTAPGLV